ncbi:CRISPR-associated protein Cas4 [Planctomycetales bacterium]|nr:CRISPR-associated protein Cas4 [Planctomycetales bacterium]GHT00749.1 CRISPR-associated protein Cas4 [Planctomycetales bacterium]GHT04421.1 CRISPR-associated protein Cas4 [Planctomycetales bacterium]
MPYSEDDLIPMSALSQVYYCERRYALIHLEQIWADNRFTAEGEVLHARVHRETRESRRTFREEYGMAVRSREWGLTGKCDLVEMWLDAAGKPARINPVEFKRGREKMTAVDRVQLCAQALCLEEMFGVAIAAGQLYYFQDHRRQDVRLDAPLRADVADLLAKIRAIIAADKTPRAQYAKKKCENCSLVDLCMPQAVGQSVAQYMRRQLGVFG